MVKHVILSSKPGSNEMVEKDALKVGNHFLKALGACP